MSNGQGDEAERFTHGGFFVEGEKVLRDARSRAAVAVRRVDVEGQSRRPRRIEQMRGGVDDALRIDGDEVRGAEREAFRTLGVSACDQNRRAEVGRFFLDASRIGDCQRGARENGDEWAEVQRRREGDARVRGQVLANARTDGGIRMQRTEHADVGAFGEQIEHRLADDVEAAAVVLAAMQSQHDQMPRRGELRQLGFGAGMVDGIA